MTFALDQQNPWFANQQDPTTPPTGGPTTPPTTPGGGGFGPVDPRSNVDTGFDPSKGMSQYMGNTPSYNVGDTLNVNDYKGWNDNQWRLAVANGSNAMDESGFMNNLRTKMMGDNGGNDASYHNYVNMYNSGGTRMAPGFHFDPTTKAYSYAGWDQNRINEANAGKIGSGNYSNPSLYNPAYSQVGTSMDQYNKNVQGLKTEQAKYAAQLQRERDARQASLVNNTGLAPKPGGVAPGIYKAPPPQVTPAVTSVANVGRLRKKP